MSFMEIKRFVNSGNTPLNTLIGTEIKKKINSDEDKSLDVIIKELLNSRDNGLAVLKQLLLDTAKESSVDEVEGLLKNNTYGLNALLNAMSSGGGGIKSVQRGLGTMNGASKYSSYGNSLFYRGITLSNVNPDKCLVSVDVIYDSTVWSYPNVMVGELRSDYLIILGNTKDDNVKFSWQVVEFN